MDPLSQFLDGPRASQAFALCVTMSAPWGIEVRDGAALTVVAVTSGSAVVGGHQLVPGDVALVRGPRPYLVGHHVDAATTIVIHPGQRCTTVDGDELLYPLTHGLRRWGNSASGETTMLIGTYQRDGEIGRLAMSALPSIAVIRKDSADAAVLALLDRELTRDGVAQATLLDRLLDLLLITSVRAWLDENPPDRSASWLIADDGVVAGALDLLHQDPAHPWTVDALARRLAISRATLAARFRSRVGRPPMTYLADWRLSLASERLAEPTATVASIGEGVGYPSPFTFSVAFKRHFGVSPAQYRREHYS